MPNWCENRLTVLGPKEDVAAFVDKAHGPVHQFAVSEREREWAKREGRDPDVPPRVETFSFHRLVPIPAEGLALVYHDPETERAGAPQGHQYEHDLWGIKWGCHDSVLVEHVDGRATYTFTTPWGPGNKFFETLSKNWPTLAFAVSFGEEYPSRGRFVIHRGAHRATTFEHDCPLKFPEGDVSDAEEEAFRVTSNTWRDEYVRTHDKWVRDLP